MSKIVICPNPARDIGLEATRGLCQALEARGMETVVFPVPDVASAESRRALRELLRGAKAVVSLGGDGTVLRVARSAAVESVPILGINFGNMGFMTQLRRDELTAAVDALAGSCLWEDRMMLEVEVRRNGASVYRELALNEAVVRGLVRLVTVQVLADDQALSQFSGDGVVVATPTGSTAYSMSAGGPIAEPTAQMLILTPLNAHGLLTRSMVLAPERVITLRPGDLRGRPAHLTVDGGAMFPLESGDAIRIQRSAVQAAFITASTVSFYDKVSEKMGDRV